MKLLKWRKTQDSWGEDIWRADLGDVQIQLSEGDTKLSCTVGASVKFLRRVGQNMGWPISHGPYREGMYYRYNQATSKVEMENIAWSACLDWVAYGREVPGLTEDQAVALDWHIQRGALKGRGAAKR